MLRVKFGLTAPRPELEVADATFGLSRNATDMSMLVIISQCKDDVNEKGKIGARHCVQDIVLVSANWLPCLRLQGGHSSVVLVGVLLRKRALGAQRISDEYSSARTR